MGGGPANRLMFNHLGRGVAPLTGHISCFFRGFPRLDIP